MSTQFVLLKRSLSFNLSFFLLVFFSLSPLKAMATASDNLLTKDIVIGAARAPVTIVEYTSFTCGHCARFHNLVLEKVKEKYVDSGKVKFIFREVYFDKFGLAGSLIGRCEGHQDFYLNFSKQLFKQQREWMSTKNEAELLSRFQDIAKEQGMSEATFTACLNNSDSADLLLDWYHKNAEKDGIKATPTFIINGEKYSNMSFEAMSELIDKELLKSTSTNL